MVNHKEEAGDVGGTSAIGGQRRCRRYLSSIHTQQSYRVPTPGLDMLIEVDINLTIKKKLEFMGGTVENSI